jgi:hypothetical protein
MAKQITRLVDSQTKEVTMELNHLEACPYCPKYKQWTSRETEYKECSIYIDRTWVNRRGGCGMYPSVELPDGFTYFDGKIVRKGRTGQQKQAHRDRSYTSKNDGRPKFMS